MRIRLTIMIVATTVLFSCGKADKSTPKKITANVDTTASAIKINREEPPADHDDKYIDTHYEYADSIGQILTIQNSLPKGGLSYTDPAGKNFVYTIFWTRITNESFYPLELSIDFPATPFELPSSAGNYVRIVLSSDIMTSERESLFDYGLSDLEASLANRLYKSSLLQKTVDPKESHTFYVVTLFDKAVEGVVRAGFSLEKQALFYRVNDQKIQTGQVNFLLVAKLWLSNAVPEAPASRGIK